MAILKLRQANRYRRAKSERAAARPRQSFCRGPIRHGGSATRDRRCRGSPDRPNRRRLHSDDRPPIPRDLRRDRGFFCSSSTTASDPDFFSWARLRTTTVWVSSRRCRLNRHLRQIRPPAEAAPVRAAAMEDLADPKTEPDHPRRSRRSSAQVRADRGVAQVRYRARGILRNCCCRNHPAASRSRPPSAFDNNSLPRRRAGSSRPGSGEVDRIEPISRN